MGIFVIFSLLILVSIYYVIIFFYVYIVYPNFKLIFLCLFFLYIYLILSYFIGILKQMLTIKLISGIFGVTQHLTTYKKILQEQTQKS